MWVSMKLYSSTHVAGFDEFTQIKNYCPQPVSLGYFSLDSNLNSVFHIFAQLL